MNLKLVKFRNLIEVSTYFADEAVCLQHLREMRWKDGAYCPHCGNAKVYEFKDGKTFKCASCRKKFSLKVGTIFEDSALPLQKWFVAIYLITSHKKGISSVQLAKYIEVTQKTAWFILHRLRHASHTKSFNRPLQNAVEVDETDIGGKEKNKHQSMCMKGTQSNNTKTQTPNAGLAERGGEVRAISVDDTKSRAVKRLGNFKRCLWLRSHHRQIQRISRHRVHLQSLFVKNGRGEYVNGHIHTNTIEGFWSILKRGI